VEEDLLQVASENLFCDQELAKRWAMLTDIEKVSKEEGIDLSWIDLTEPDPRNRPQAMRNERLRPIWKSEEEIEIKGLWERGCFKRIKRSDLPADACVILPLPLQDKKDPRRRGQVEGKTPQGKTSCARTAHVTAEGRF
jgi:hypothetical protein